MKNTCNVGVIAYTSSGSPFHFYIPVFDSFPKDIAFVFAHQHFVVGAINDKVLLTLFCANDEGDKYYEQLDVTKACREDAPLRLCIVKTSELCVLYAYSDSHHNGQFPLSTTFKQKAGLL